jgi:hypothetical protein
MATDQRQPGEHGVTSVELVIITPIPVTQRRGRAEVACVDRGLLLPPHLGDLLVVVVKVGGHGHADQLGARTCLLTLAGGARAGALSATRVSGEELDDLLADTGEACAQLDQDLGGDASPSRMRPSRRCYQVDFLRRCLGDDDPASAKLATTVQDPLACVIAGIAQTVRSGVDRFRR